MRFYNISPKIIFITTALLLSMIDLSVLAQQNVGIGTASPNASAALDITATDKGMLVPRLTTTQMNAIVSPAAGLMVYNTDSAAFAYRNATAWVFIKGNAGASNDWSTKGNAGTTPANHFIGTTDNQDLVFKRNNIRAGLINANSGNTSWGAETLNPVSSGVHNTATGYQTLLNNTTGNVNTAAGSQTLTLNTTGNANTAIGAFALLSNLSGISNSAVGYRALDENITGDYNTANGTNALGLNRSGYSNVAIGAYALYGNIDRSNLVAIGDSALWNNGQGVLNNSYDATKNTAVGSKALFSNTTGNHNTAIGYNALYSNTDRSNLLAIGDSALYNNGTGVTNSTHATNNTAVGSKALRSNSTGYENTAVGALALSSNTTGEGNLAVGSKALNANTTGDANTANGRGALFSNTTGYFNTGHGFFALSQNKTGSGNTALGSWTLSTNTTGTLNTAMGDHADVITADLTNTTAIGANAKVGRSYSLVLGDSSNVNVGIGTGYPSTAKLVIKTGAGLNGIDLSSADAYAEMRVIRNTLNPIDKDLYFNFAAPNPSSIHMYSDGAETMTIRNGSVAVGTANPASTAALEISSTTKGLLPPRMSHAQRDAIASPATGLIIWCTDCGLHGQAQLYNGAEWTNMLGGARDPFIGEGFQGGIVAYILQPGDPGYVQGQAHGLISATSDLGSAVWGCNGVSIVGTSAAIWSGANNTNLITAGCATAGIAARICNNLVLNGYSDWYLPSENDLKKLSINQVIIGGFSATNYWSSTQNDLNFASTIDFNTNNQTGADKTLSFPVRAVRSF